MKPSTIFVRRNSDLDLFFNSTFRPANYTDGDKCRGNLSYDDLECIEPNYFALFLLIIPVLTIFGNALVVISIVREKSLQTATNFLIASLAISDFLVAFVVMPFAVYAVVEKSVWNLPKVLCNIYIAADVCASTASILNLVAVSWDRYTAVSRPIAYIANSKSNLRVKTTIFIVWFISIAIAMPVVSGLNDLGYTVHCEFTNAMYIVASSIGSFYLPCIIIIILYGVVLKKLQVRRRLKKQRKCSAMEFRPNGAQTVVMEAEYMTVADNYKDERFFENVAAIQNIDKSSKKSELFADVMQKEKPQSFDTESIPFIDDSSEKRVKLNAPECPSDVYTEDYYSPKTRRKNGMSLRQSCLMLNATNNSLANVESSMGSSSPMTSEKRRNVMRESRQMRKDTKATQTLAIVLGVFLLCWLPFFICHLTNSLCMLRFGNVCISMNAFFFTTWLGYMNSFMNPVIYTVFNAEYRKAFCNILFHRDRRRRFVL